MEFRETLLAAQRNQQQKSSDNMYYKARFDPPKKEQKPKDKLSANIQKFLAKKEEEERLKKLEAQKKRDELLAMRDPKALRKIQKTLKVIKSANKSVLQDAVDHDNTAVTREGPDQPDQDDYGYESQEAAALYQKMMQKYSKLPDEPKFSTGKSCTKKDLNGTRERVKHALQHEDDPVPHKRRRRGETSTTDHDTSPPSKYEPEKRKEDISKSDKPKIRKPMPPPMDFNQLLKLAEEKKSVPIEIASKKPASESAPERPMTKKQRREYEEEQARLRRRQERLDSEKSGARKNYKDDEQREKKPETSGIGKIPKLGEKHSTVSKEKISSDREKTERLQKEKERAKLERDKADKEKERLDRERLEKLKAERERIDRELEKLSKDKDRLEKTKSKIEANRTSDKSVNKPIDRSKLASRELSGPSFKKPIDMKSENTYRIDKNLNEKKGPEARPTNGVKMSKEQLIREKAALLAKQKALLAQGSNKLNGQSKADPVKKCFNDKSLPVRRPDDKKQSSGLNSQAGSSKQKLSNSFDFDKHVNSLKGRQFPPGDVRRKQNSDDKGFKQKRRVLDSDEEYDSEMDDFIDDADEEMDYSKHIKEIFGYDKSRYRNINDEDDPSMESSFARQQREEFISKKIGIMEDLEDMRLEAMQNKKKGKKGRRISDD